jgi:quercetin dioxygenase-like cupin family protein
MTIKGVIYQSRGVNHEDHRRTLLTAFNGDLGDFVAKQVKFAMMKEDAVLGGHYHDYDELFYLLGGEGTFALKDPAEELIERYDMIRGDRLFIPRGIAHRATVKAGSILVGCTGEPYVSPEHNDHRYDF